MMNAITLALCYTEDIGKKITLTAGMSYQVSDDQSEHRSYSPQGAKLIIVDGDFLKPE